jgi:hypothetical protein
MGLERTGPRHYVCNQYPSRPILVLTGSSRLAKLDIAVFESSGLVDLKMEVSPVPHTMRGYQMDFASRPYTEAMIGADRMMGNGLV